MRIQVIDDENPLPLWLMGKGFGDVKDEVIFCATLPYRRSNDSAGGDFLVSNQADGPMADRLVRSPLNLFFCQWDDLSLECLNPRFLIAGDEMNPVGMKFSCMGV